MTLLLTLLLSPAWCADPFERWPTHSAHDGFGQSLGVSVADIDGDGWTDVVVPAAHVIWRNVEGTGWQRLELPQLAEAHGRQYGASLADYNGDGLPDLLSEPRGGNPVLLRNEGSGAFSVLPPEQFVPPVSYQMAETIGWVDVDADGLLDVFVPAYSGRSGLWHNLGADGDGRYHFDEVAYEAGIALSQTMELRPEGAQFVDIDRDGDADLYVCGDLLRNTSAPGVPRFVTDPTTGIVPAFDEGAAFADIDMDGDFDLGVLYQTTWLDEHPEMAMLFWENLGDSTFRLLPLATAEHADISGGSHIGMSFADWDLDGDPDVTFSDRVERNDVLQTGTTQFRRIETVAAHPRASPAWFDWDHDGDLDVAVSTGGQHAIFYDNTLYDDVLPADRHYLRVRPVQDSVRIPTGLDSAFAATVEVRVVGEAPEVRRRQFTASGHGYVNQSEYALTFGLEGVSEPIVDVSVDFVNDAARGVWRVDKHVNPALGGIDVRSLADREVRVMRNGIVIIDGKRLSAGTRERALLVTPGGVWTPSIAHELKAPDAQWVGVHIEVPLDAEPDRGAAIREVLVEGQLADGVDCDGIIGNVMLWDVSDGGARIVASTTGAVSSSNRRTDVPTDFVLTPGHAYRVLARVRATRQFEPASDDAWLTVHGAVSANTCDAESVGGAVVKPGPLNLAVRYRDRVVPGDPVDTDEPVDTGVPIDTDDPGPSASTRCGCTTSSTTSAWLPLLWVLMARRRQHQQTAKTRRGFRGSRHSLRPVPGGQARFPAATCRRGVAPTARRPRPKT